MPAQAQFFDLPRDRCTRSSDRSENRGQRRRTPRAPPPQTPTPQALRAASSRQAPKMPVLAGNQRLLLNDIAPILGLLKPGAGRAKLVFDEEGSDFCEADTSFLAIGKAGHAVAATSGVPSGFFTWRSAPGTAAVALLVEVVFAIFRKWRVNRCRLDERQRDRRPLQFQFYSESIGNPFDRVLRGTMHALKRQPVSEAMLPRLMIAPPLSLRHIAAMVIAVNEAPSGTNKLLAGGPRWLAALAFARARFEPRACYAPRIRSAACLSM
jgi:hypothetical protein